MQQRSSSPVTRRSILGAAAALVGLPRLSAAAPAPEPELVWVDDFRAGLPCDHGAVAPDGRVYQYTLAAFLEDEADEALSPVVGRVLRDAAARCRSLGILTQEDFCRAGRWPG